MADKIQFDEFRSQRQPLCLACEEMLPDALDHSLPEADQRWFDQHTATCLDCSEMLADAQRGAAWLELLKAPRPEPSAALVERILAQTSGLETSGIQTTSAADTLPQPGIFGQPALLPTPLPARSNLLSFRPRLPQFAAWSNSRFEPRLAMTAAMAFFSIALTLNLTGVRLDRLNARSLSPAGIKRSYYEANAEAVRFYDNLRVVRVMESRVDTLRTDDRNQDRTPEPTPDPTPDSTPQPSAPDKAPDPHQQNRLELPGPAQPRLVPTSASLHAAAPQQGGQS